MLDLRTMAEAACVLAERRAEDGLADLLAGSPGPFVHQAALWGSAKPEAWLFGANRSGKTEGVAALGAAFLRFGNPDPRPAYGPSGIVVYDRAVRVWAVSLNYDMSRNIFQPKMFDNGAGIAGRRPFIPSSELLPGTQGWNITNQMLRLKNGSVCLFKSCDAGRDAFQGADIDLAIFDEVPIEEVYKEVAMRVGGGRRLLIRGAATILPPAGVPGGVSWMFKAKVTPWLALAESPPERNAASDTLDIFSAAIYDNTTILPEELARMEAQYPPGSPEYLIRMKGVLLPSIGGALVYSNFMRTYHTFTVTPDAKVVDPYLPLVLAVDFNPENGVWVVGQRQGRTYRVLDEITMERSDIASMTYEFRSRFPAHQAELWIYGDATGRRRNEQTGLSNFHLIQNYLSGYPCPIRFMLPDVNPPVVDRVAAMQLALRPPDGTKRLEVATRCEQTITDLETTKWRGLGKIDKSGGSTMQSNGADCIGYWIAADAPVRPAAMSARGIRSIRTPSYTAHRSGPFPAAFSNLRVRAIRRALSA